MAERSVRVVEPEDEKKELPVINNVRVITKKVEIDPDADAFNRSASVVKDYDGNSSVQKTRITKAINKAAGTGTGGARSKQIEEKEGLTAYDVYGVVEPPTNLVHLAKLYDLNPTHHAAVDAKVTNIVGLGFKFVETYKTKAKLEEKSGDEEGLKSLRRKLDKHRNELTDQIDSFNKNDTFTETLIKVWRDYETTGNGYLEIGRKRDGSVGYLGHIPAVTIRMRRQRDGFVQMSGDKVQFFALYGAGIDDDGQRQKIANPIGSDTPNEVIHFKRYSPTSGYYGIPDIVSATDAIAGVKFAANYNLDYFENKAVPRYAIILKGATLGSNAESALLSFFETGLKGQNHRSIYIPLPADTADNKVELKLEAIEDGVQDSSFNNYRKANISDILQAHRVPISKVDTASGMSLAAARDADKTFKEQVCGPEQDIAEKKINRVVKELTDAFEIDLNEMSLTDENTQSQIDERRRKTGVETANEQRNRRGEPSIDGGDELFDMNAATKLAEMADETTRRGQDKSAEQAAAAAAAKPAASAGANASGNPAGTRQRDTQRSANRTDSAGEGRNPKGEGRTTP